MEKWFVIWENNCSVADPRGWVIWMEFFSEIVSHSLHDKWQDISLHTRHSAFSQPPINIHYQYTIYYILILQLNILNDIATLSLDL